MLKYKGSLPAFALLAALLLLCGCSPRAADPAPTAVPAEQTVLPVETAVPMPTANDSGAHRTVEGPLTITGEKCSAVPDGAPLLHILPGGDLSAEGWMLDLAAGEADPAIPGAEQAAVLTEAGGSARFSACAFASNADRLPLLCSYGKTVLTDTMAVHTGAWADGFLTADGGSMEAVRCDLFAGGSGSACLSAGTGGTIVCTAGTRISANGGSLALRLSDGGSIAVQDGSILGDILLSGCGNTLTCTNTVLTGNLRFETAEDEIDLQLRSGSHFHGTTDGDGAIGIRISLDASSTWTLTDNAYVAALHNEDTTLSNIRSSGFSLYYNAESEENLWLQGKTRALADGGFLIPLI